MTVLISRRELALVCLLIACLLVVGHDVWRMVDALDATLKDGRA